MLTCAHGKLLHSQNGLEFSSFTMYQNTSASTHCNLSVVPQLPRDTLSPPHHAAYTCLSQQLLGCGHDLKGMNLKGVVHECGRGTKMSFQCPLSLCMQFRLNYFLPKVPTSVYLLYGKDIALFLCRTVDREHIKCAV